MYIHVYAHHALVGFCNKRHIPRVRALLFARMCIVVLGKKRNCRASTRKRTILLAPRMGSPLPAIQDNTLKCILLCVLKKPYNTIKKEKVIYCVHSCMAYECTVFHGLSCHTVSTSGPSLGSKQELLLQKFLLNPRSCFDTCAVIFTVKASQERQKGEERRQVGRSVGGCIMTGGGDALPHAQA